MAYGIAGMVEDAVSVVKEMREHGIDPDRITYVNLITALRRNDNILEAVKWSLWMKQRHFSVPNELAKKGLPAQAVNFQARQGIVIPSPWLGATCIKS
ncbi:hypothetical protein Ancab_027673 [Ancistrocladus abbreviatus]